VVCLQEPTQRSALAVCSLRKPTYRCQPIASDLAAELVLFFRQAPGYRCPGVQAILPLFDLGEQSEDGCKLVDFPAGWPILVKIPHKSIDALLDVDQREHPIVAHPG
jgi:hypothetical protein